MGDQKALKRIKVTTKMSSVRRSVERAAQDVEKVRSNLTAGYFDQRSQMGISKDLDVVDDKYESMLKSVDNLSGALSNYAEILKAIRKNYRDMQQAAIERAYTIP